MIIIIIVGLVPAASSASEGTIALANNQVHDFSLLGSRL
jgi:hypothetical protein